MIYRYPKLKLILTYQECISVEDGIYFMNEAFPKVRHSLWYLNSRNHLNLYKSFKNYESIGWYPTWPHSVITRHLLTESSLRDWYLYISVKLGIAYRVNI